MGGSGGGGGGDTETTIRYADYIEDKHSAFLDEVQAQRIAAIPNNPFTGYVDIDFADAFFGAGYVISDFPSLYDMYGKFMAGLDVDTLYTQILDDSINNVAINNRVSQHAIELEDDIIQSASPRFVTGLRDINSVLSSSFVIGKAMLETARTKALSKYDAELRLAMLPVAASRWQTHLEWNKVVIREYAEIMKLYFSSAMDLDNHNYTMDAKAALWPFTLSEYERAALGALQGATNSKTDVAGASQTQKVIGGALTGAAAGALIGNAVAPGVGGCIGGALGGILGGATGFL
jgi:hypothetical protein